MVQTGLIPGANRGGSNIAVPNGGASTIPAIGSSQGNPLLPQNPGGSATAPISSSINGSAASAPPSSTAAGTTITVPPFPANGTGSTSPTGFPNIFTASNPGGGTSRVSNGQWNPNQKDFIKAAKKAGYSAADAAMLFNFLQSGAGYNPQVAQALIDSMQPMIQRGEADIMEQFSNMGLRNGSPAAIGLGDFLSQVNLNEGQIMAGLYQQSVQNYMNVLMGMKGEHVSGFDQLLKWISTSSQAALAGAKIAGG